MSIKIDLRIFLFGALFFFTKQIEIYAVLMIFALLHELGHLCAGIVLGFKPKSIKVNPLGFQICFHTKIEDYNRKVKKGNELCIKKIIIALAGPAINIIMVLFCLYIKQELIISKEMVIYSNILLALFNMLPIYPLDGGSILKEIVHVFKGKETSYKIINRVSRVTVIILTIITSILTFYIHNVAFLIILCYLWYLVIKNQKEYQLYLRIIGN